MLLVVTSITPNNNHLNIHAIIFWK